MSASPTNEDIEPSKDELDTLVAHIAVLAQLALRMPDAFEQKSERIMEFLVKQVLQAALEEDVQGEDEVSSVCNPVYPKWQHR